MSFFANAITMKRRDENGEVMYDDDGLEMTYDTLEAYEAKDIIDMILKKIGFDKQNLF